LPIVANKIASQGQAKRPSFTDISCDGERKEHFYTERDFVLSNPDY